MKITEASLALLIPALLVATAGGYLTTSNVDIDYSHNVVGTGTVITDYKMGSTESTEAMGKVRGTGEVMNKYVFQSNSSENVTINDQFLFTEIKPRYVLAIRDYPQMTKSPGRLRMIGTTWAENIEISFLK
jgi:hypothetical protein